MNTRYPNTPNTRQGHWPNKKLISNMTIFPLKQKWLLIWVWINTYYIIPFLVGWTSINPSYFDVNYRGTIGFDTLPFPNMPNCFFHLSPRTDPRFFIALRRYSKSTANWLAPAAVSSLIFMTCRPTDPSIHWSITMFPIEIAIFSLGVVTTPELKKTHQSRKQKSAAGIGWKAGIKYRSK